MIIDDHTASVNPSPEDLAWYAEHTGDRDLAADLAKAEAWRIRREYPLTRADNPDHWENLLDRYPPDTEDEELVRLEAERIARNREFQRRFRTLGDLVRYVADCLKPLGLEPEVHAHSFDLQYLGHTVEFRATDIDVMIDHLYREHHDNRGATDDELAMIAAGLPVG